MGIVLIQINDFTFSVNTTGTTVKSRIPRPVTSPVRPDVGRSRIPRASRADGLDRITGVGRPSSLPQSRGPPPTHPSTTRRAASSSSTRPSTKKTQPANNRYTHLFLSFNSRLFHFGFIVHLTFYSLLFWFIIIYLFKSFLSLVLFKNINFCVIVIFYHHPKGHST